MLGRALGVAIAYVAATEVCLRLTPPDANFVMLWLPSGIYLAALLLAPVRTWWVFIGTTYVANAAVNIVHGLPVWLTVLYCTVNTLEPVVGAVLLQWRERRGVRRGSFTWYVTLVAVVCAVTAFVSAPIGSLFTSIAFDQPFVLTWLAWSSRNTIGALVVVPFAVAWATGKAQPSGVSLRRALEATAIFGGLVVSIYVVFAMDSEHFGLGRGFLVLPFTLAAALRLGTRGATSAGLVLALGAAFLSVSRIATDPLTPEALALNISALQGYLAVHILTALAAATALAALRSSEQRLAQLSRCHAFVGRVAEAVVRIHEQEPLLREACRLAVRAPQVSVACAVILDRAEGLRIVASRRSEDGESQEVDLAPSLMPLDLRALFVDHQPYVSDDLESDPLLEPLHQGTACPGCRALLAIPLHTAEGWRGVFMMFAFDPTVFVPESVEILARAGADLSLALAAMDREAARRHAEDEHQRLVGLIEHSTELVALTTDDWRVTYLNPAGARLVGLTPEQAREINILDFVRHDLRTDFEQHVAINLAASGSWRGTLHLQTEPEIEIEGAVFVPGFVPGKPPSAIAVVMRDVTEQHRLETQQAQADKMEAVGRLAGGVAHDFNNLLTVINGNAQLALLVATEGAPVNAALSEIMEAGKRAAVLTRQLLTFSRRQVVAPQPTELNGIVRGVERLLRRLIREDIVFATDLSSDTGLVDVDSGQFEHLIVNLTVNARDAMAFGGSLTIATRRVTLDAVSARSKGLAQGGDYAVLAVTDTGEGMSKKTQEHIFEPFFTTKPRGKGTGLGLATVFGIVQECHGAIEVASEIGAGTRFTVYLPRLQEAVVQTSTTAQSSSLSALPGGHETILCVEDDAQVRDIVFETATCLGYRVLLAENGRDARKVSRAHDGPIDLLMTDVIMPEMNGRQVAEHLVAERPGLKVLYMSGYSDEVLSNQGVLEPGFTLLGKPFSVEQLAHGLRSLLDRDKP
jgi:PAS domain S-box-containing protein